MCGICGELRFDGRPAGAETVVAMRERLVHRGPDSFGSYCSPAGRCALAFRRLRIIDLTANAGQPMANEDGSVQVVFNGEIYNFRELRDRLAAQGHRFRSKSDTEAIVHLYEELGADCIASLDGMFAIAIWDERARRLMLARDRAGKKPLFYYRSGRLLAFASEMKAFFAHPDIVMEVDPASVPYYFIHGYVPGPSTFYKSVRQLEPGALMIVEDGGDTTARRYWRLAYPRESEVKAVPAGEAAARVRELVTGAVRRRLVSDVPLGAFLSGGIDSTIVVGLMSQLTPQPVKTFSIGFEGDAAYDESAYARLAAERFRTDHTEFRVAPDAVDLIDALIWHHDGPFGDASAVPTWIVARLARAHVTVVLTGDGGDEVFAGYRRFQAALQSERIPRSAARAGQAVFSRLSAPGHERGWLAELQRFLNGSTLSFDERMTTWNAIFFHDLQQLLRPDFAAAVGPVDRLHYLDAARPEMDGVSMLSRLLHVNFTSYLADDLLVKVDRCTMASSLEARSPFLDWRLIDYVAALPDACKLRGRRTKAVLRDAFHDLLPREIDRRPKMGFGVPLGAWLRGSLRDYMRDLLLTRDARYRTMLSASHVERLVHDHLSGAANAGPQLWSLICFERWLQMLPEWRDQRTSSHSPTWMPTGLMS
jgi:asparagine synthase (glutamine-hydrolysing)